MSGKKEYTIFQEEGFKYYNYIVTCLNYLIFIEKKYLCCDAER